MRSSCFAVVALFLLFMMVTLTVSAQDYRLKVVYVVPSDREPHADYDVRLDYVIKMIQRFFSETLESAGYASSASVGKSFEYEADGFGNLVVHLVDHSPDGNDPDPTRTVSRYQSGEINPWEDIAEHLPASFFVRSAAIILVDQSRMNTDHYLRDAPQGGAGESGPDKNGYVIGTDHFFGNDLTYGITDPPILFETMGRNDSEQLAIFHDTRFTNIKMGSISWRPAPPSWNPGEHPSVENLRVWEYATITLGALTHEIGHMFALPHSFRYTQGASPGIYGDFNIMGNGYRRIYRSFFPEESFTQEDQYPRLSSIYDDGFGTEALFHPVQHPRLNRNQFFNTEMTLSDFVRPTLAGLQVRYDPDNTALEVEYSVRDSGSGLSHITYLMDWNAHAVDVITPGKAFEQLERQTVLSFLPQEYSGFAFSRGIHSLVAEAMDCQGNVPVFSDSLYYYGIGDGYLQHWKIYSEYIDTTAVLGLGASFEEKLVHAYFSTDDALLDPKFNQHMGEHIWRYVPTGAYLSVTDKMPYYFIDPPAWSDDRLCYAATHLVSNCQRQLNLLLGYNDYIQVFWNGTQKYVDTEFSGGHYPFDPNYYVSLPLTVQHGENRLLVKHFNDSSWGGFWGCFRETDGSAVEVVPHPPSDPNTLSIRTLQPSGLEQWAQYR